MKTLTHIATLVALTVGLGLPMPAHAETYTAILDYATGELLDYDSNPDLKYLNCDVVEDETGFTFTTDVSYARITKGGIPTEDNVDWVVQDPMAGSKGGCNEPTTPSHHIYAKIPIKYKSFKATLLELEYKDFYNYRLGATSIIASWPRECYYIKPYQGFLPAEFTYEFLTDYLGYPNQYQTLWFFYDLAQYDYEHQVVRAYTHIKVRVDYLTEESAAAEVEAAEAPARYFNLQGIEVSDPKVGEIYIEWQGHTTRKRRF